MPPSIVGPVFVCYAWASSESCAPAAPTIPRKNTSPNKKIYICKQLCEKLRTALASKSSSCELCREFKKTTVVGTHSHHVYHLIPSSCILSFSYVCVPTTSVNLKPRERHFGQKKKKRKYSSCTTTARVVCSQRRDVRNDFFLSILLTSVV